MTAPTVPVSYDPRLVVLSIAIAVAASYTFLEIAVRLNAATSRASAIWITCGSLMLGCGIWATHFVGMASYRVPLAVHYDAQLIVASCLVAIAAIAIALSVTEQARGDFATLGVASLIIGGGIAAMHYTGMAAMEAMATQHDEPWRIIGMTAFAVGSAYFALVIAFRLRGQNGLHIIASRLASALLLGAAIVGMHYAGLGAIDLSSAELAPVSSDIALPAIVGSTILVLVLVVLIISISEGGARRERSRTITLDDSHERGGAAALQRALLPRELPHVEGLRFSTAYLPGSRDENVGGDWFDAFVLDDGRVALSVGDVAGRGVSAASWMSVVRQSCRAAAYEDPDPGSVLFRVNRLLVRSEGKTMVTAIFGVLDPITLEFRYASAGHPPPLVGQSSGSVESLAGIGMPLGIFDDYDAQTHVTLLDPAAMLVLYTDGFIAYSRDVLAGAAGLRRAIEVAHARQAADPARSISEDVLAKHRRMDDAAIMTVQLAPTLSEFELGLPAIGSNAPGARNALRRYIDGVALTAERRFDLLLCAGEAIANAIEHAYLDRRPGEFRLRARTVAGVAIIEIEDDGIWRDARTNDRGRGIPLMRSLLDGVEIIEHTGGTTVQLTMSLRRRPVLA